MVVVVVRLRHDRIRNSAAKQASAALSFSQLVAPLCRPAAQCLKSIVCAEKVMRCPQVNGSALGLGVLRDVWRSSDEIS